MYNIEYVSITLCVVIIAVGLCGYCGPFVSSESQLKEMFDIELYVSYACVRPRFIILRTIGESNLLPIPAPAFQMMSEFEIQV